jgi:hypothetical protein
MVDRERRRDQNAWTVKRSEAQAHPARYGNGLAHSHRPGRALVNRAVSGPVRPALRRRSSSSITPDRRSPQPAAPEPLLPPSRRPTTLLPVAALPPKDAVVERETRSHPLRSGGWVSSGVHRRGARFSSRESGGGKMSDFQTSTHRERWIFQPQDLVPLPDPFFLFLCSVPQGLLWPGTANLYSLLILTIVC